MTRGLRGRVEALEGARAAKVSASGVFEADLDAGVWRNVHTGEAGPALPEEEGPESVRQVGGVLFLFAGSPARVIAGIRWTDL